MRVCCEGGREGRRSSRFAGSVSALLRVKRGGTVCVVRIGLPRADLEMIEVPFLLL